MAKTKSGSKAPQKLKKEAAPLRRGITQPKTRGYRFRDHGRPQSRLSDDNLTIRLDGPAVEVVRPSFTGGPTVFRPFPARSAEDPTELDPVRYTADELDFTDWIRDYPVATYVGTAKQKTFILWDPKDQTYDRSGNPYVIFANNVINGVKKHAAGKGRWNSLVPGISNKPAVKWPTVMYMMQGLCYAHGDKIYVLDGPPRGAGKDDKPLILQTTKSVGDVITKKFDILRKGYKGPEDNYERMFKYGDPVSFDTGRFLTIFNPDKGAGAAAAGATGEKRKADWQAGGKRKGEEKGAGAMSSYDVKVTKTYEVGKNVYEAAMPEKAEAFTKRIVFFDEVVRVPSHEEICIFVAQAFADMPKMLEYAWADHGSFFTDDVEKIMKSRTTHQSVDVPDDDDEDEDDDGDDAPKGKARGSAKSASLSKRKVADDDEDDDSKETRVAKKGNAKKRPQDDDEDEDDDLEDEGLDDEDEDDDADDDADDDGDDEDDDAEEQEDDDVDADDDDEDSDDDEDDDGDDAEDDDADDEDSDDDESDDEDDADDDDAEDDDEDGDDEDADDDDEDSDDDDSDEDDDSDGDDDDADEDDDDSDEDDDDADEDDDDGDDDEDVAPPPKKKDKKPAAKAPAKADVKASAGKKKGGKKSQVDVDAEEAELEAATRAAEKRSGRRDADDGKKASSKGKAPAQEKGAAKADKKNSSKSGKSSATADTSKEPDMAAKKTAAKPAVKSTKKSAGKKSSKK